MCNIIKKTVHNIISLNLNISLYTIKASFLLAEVITLEITDIRIRQMNNEDKMKAVVSVTFDNCFVVHDIKVIDGQDRLFIAMPSRKTPDNEYKDIAHPINIEMREHLQSSILEKYHATLVAGE